jgi:hypothetical protein
LSYFWLFISQSPTNSMSNKLRAVALLSFFSLVVVTVKILTQNVPQVEASYTGTKFFNTNSPFNRRIPSSATYSPTGQIFSLRQASDMYTMPIYRIGSAAGYPIVTITNWYGRSIQWPVPAGAQPATGTDANMAVLDKSQNKILEMWNAHWQDSLHILAGQQKESPLDGNGINDPPNETISAAGFAVVAGMVVREDFYNPTTNKLDNTLPIAHALSVSLPKELIRPDAYVAPAIKGENCSICTGTIPMGALFALSRNTPVNSLNVHPLTKKLALAARDYGMYVNNHNSAPLENNKGVATVKVEPGLVQSLYGQGNDELLTQVENEMAEIVKQYGVNRISGIDFSYANQPVSSTNPSPSPSASPIILPAATPVASPTPSPSASPKPTPSPSPSPSPTPVTAPGTVTDTVVEIAPNADTYVRQGDPTLADGANTVVKVGSGANDVTYLRFNLSNLAGKTIKSAKLRFYITNTSPEQQTISTVNSNDWGEAMNFTTQPGFGAQFKTITSNGATGWFEVDMTSYIATRVGTTFSIGIRSASSPSADGFWFNSRESTNKPVIKVTY